MLCLISLFREKIAKKLPKLISSQCSGATYWAFCNALENAALGAVLAGSQEQNRLYNLQQTNRNQAISDMLLERNQPINSSPQAMHVRYDSSISTCLNMQSESKTN